MSPITYISEQANDYAHELDAADTLGKLVMMMHNWQELAGDAHHIVCGMTDDDFLVFRNGLAKERRHTFAGEEFSRKYGAVMMPETLIKIGLIAFRFGVPWGCAYLQLKEHGNLERALA